MGWGQRGVVTREVDMATKGQHKASLRWNSLVPVAVVDIIIYTCDKTVYNTNDYKKNWGI